MFAKIAPRKNYLATFTVTAAPTAVTSAFSA